MRTGHRHVQFIRMKLPAWERKNNSIKYICSNDWDETQIVTLVADCVCYDGIAFCPYFMALLYRLPLAMLIAPKQSLEQGRSKDGRVHKIRPVGAL
jgi:hypothetical protein